MPQRLICFANIECIECRSLLVLTFEWPHETPPTGDARMGPRLLMCPSCRSPLVWLLPAGMRNLSVRPANGASRDGAVAVPFLEHPPDAIGEPWRRKSAAAAALPAIERLQYFIWTYWPALYALVYLRQC